MGAGFKADAGKLPWRLLPFDALDQVIAVLAFGVAKYTRYEGCTCAASAVGTDPTRDEDCAAPATTVHYGQTTRGTQPGSVQHPGRGGSDTQNALESYPDSPTRGLTQNKRRPAGSGVSTDSLLSSTPQWRPPDAVSADRSADCTWIMTTEPDACGASCATPATSASDSSSGPAGGLTRHSPTCGGRLVSGAGNWEKVQDGHARYMDAAMRHMRARYGGEILDSESGLPHLAHAACCCLFSLAFDLRKKED